MRLPIVSASISSRDLYGSSLGGEPAVVGAYKLVVPLLGTCCHWQELEGRELELQGAALISSLSKPCSSCF